MSHKHHQKKYQNTTEYQDPVCHMKVSEKTAIDLYMHNGQTFYFCSTDCKTLFAESPEKYLHKKKL
jgi:Cu+-exporting ATPase